MLPNENIQQWTKLNMYVIVMGTYCQVSEDEVVLSRIQLH